MLSWQKIFLFCDVGTILEKHPFYKAKHTKQTLRNTVCPVILPTGLRGRLPAQHHRAAAGTARAGAVGSASRKRALPPASFQGKIAAISARPEVWAPGGTPVTVRNSPPPSRQTPAQAALRKRGSAGSRSANILAFSRPSLNGDDMEHLTCFVFFAF